MKIKKSLFFIVLLIFVNNALPGIAGDDNPFTVQQLDIPGIVDVEVYIDDQKSLTPELEKEAEHASYEIGYVSVNTRLNVRTGPWGNIIGKLYDGDKIKIVGREGDWLKIQYNGETAYVHSHYVDIGQERASRPPVDYEGPVEALPEGSLSPARFGYDESRFKSVFDIVEKFCSANKAYVFGAGHKKTSGYAEKTDCSGFVGQFVQKMAEVSGVPPVFPKDSWYPYSQLYKTKHTNKITSSFPPPNPRDAIQPGDIFVLNPGSSGVGHVGLFMGYSPSGQPIIAHSTPSRVRSSSRVAGKVGYSGVRIETLPSRYRSRWAGVYRVENMKETLDKLDS